MNRRDFLKVPALGLVLPALLPAAEAAGEPGAPVQPGPAGRRQDPPGGAVPRQAIHPDFDTYVEGIEYYFVGNGEIMGAIQHAPKDSKASFIGFTLMLPDHFSRKWSTFLYHPERGLTHTRLGVSVQESPAAAGAAEPDHAAPGRPGGAATAFALTPETFQSLSWEHPEGVPAVTLAWKAGTCLVREEFFTPPEGSVLLRRVTVQNTGSIPAAVGLSLLLYPNFGLFDEIRIDEQERAALADGWTAMRLQALTPGSAARGRYEVTVDLETLAPGQQRQAVYAYAVRGGEKIFREKSYDALWQETQAYWKGRSSVRTGDAVVDHLMNVSRAGLRAVTARNGKMDAATWMYNMEWVSDQALAIEALLRCGFVEEARVMTERNLRTNIGPDGRTIESSRWAGYDYTEINQNGMLLYGLWSYLAWTGDLELIRKHWDKVKLCADFPLTDHFLDPATGMVRNKREFWERSDMHGVKQGYELAYQTWIAFGLEKAAAVARLLGAEAEAERWARASARMKESMLEHPRFSLVEEGHFIKRRTVEGEWQRTFLPPDRARMPKGSPLALEAQPSPEPDSVEVYPVLCGLVDPAGSLSTETLRWMEQIWNQRWEIGGYPRYNTTSEDNPPAPWPIASLLIARAYAAAGDSEKAWRVLRWLRTIPGGNSGSWFERYGQSITPPMPPVCVVGWVWYEVLALMVEHVMGFRPDLDGISVAPRLLTGINEITARETVRGSRVSLAIRRSKERAGAVVNGTEVALRDGVLRLSYPLAKEVSITIDVKD